MVLGSHLALGIGAFAYAGPLRRALAQLKYEGAARVALPIARCSRPSFDQLLVVTGAAVLTSVPIHVDRQRARGYNQATLIARELGAGTNMAVRDLLVRARSTTRQHRLDRAGRLRNLRGAMAVAAGVTVPPVVIVVDDIITTSATLDACAATLRENGARTVYGFAIAREV